MSSRYDPALFYPSPSSRFHRRQSSEPPPSPVSSHAYNNDCEFDSIFYKQQRRYPSETDSEDEQSPTVSPPSSRSSNGTSSPDDQPPPLTPMSPVPSEKTMSISGVSLSAVVPGTPVGRRMSLMPPSCVPGLSEVESDEWNEDDDDLETETETETEPHSWVGHDNNLHIADSVAALYAATNNVALGPGDSRHPSWGHSQPKAPAPRPRIPSMTARVAEAAASQHHSRDSLFEMLAQEKFVHSKHPFATPNPSTASSATKATSSMTSLLSPANVNVAPAQSVSGPPTPSPPANRPLVVVSTQAISTQSRASRLVGHNRALTTTDVSASDPIPLPEPPFSAPADASRHPVSYQSTTALSPAHSSPLLEPRPAPKPPQHAPLTILTNVNINTNAFTTVSPVANTGRWCSHRTVIAGKPCCHVSVSDDEEPRKEPTSRKSLIASKVFRRARSYTTKDAPQLHHELQHSVQVTHDYHYTKRVPDAVSTTTVTARPLTWCEPATATTVTKTAKRSPPVGQRHITPHGPVPRTPSKSSMSSSDAAQAPKSSPQHILPPSELHTYRKRHNHVPPPLEIPVANLHRSSFMVVADDDDEVNRSRRNSAYVITYRPPSRLHSRNPSHDSNGSSATVSSKGSSESRGSETKSTPKAKFKPKVHIAKGKTADGTHNAYAELHSYRRAHNPTPRKASFNDGDDEDSDSDSDDENLEVASPFAPSDWGYERYGFKMPVA